MFSSAYFINDNRKEVVELWHLHREEGQISLGIITRVYGLPRDFSIYFQKQILDQIEHIAQTHAKFEQIHPFSDGNGRISRLIMNFVLKNKDFHLLDIPYTKRTSYYNALERSQVNNDENIFVQWFFRRYLAEYKKYLKKR